MTDWLEWLPQQRWFAHKSQGLISAEPFDRLELEGGEAITLLQVELGTGQHTLYQLIPDDIGALAAAIAAGGDRETECGLFSFRSVGEGESGGIGTNARPLGAEQSNTSIVLDDRQLLKVLRKLEPGINPELEMLRFLSANGYAHIAPLHGWYEYEGRNVVTTLGVVQEFVADARDGWELALEEIPSDPARFLDRIAGLGAATAQLHNTLGSDDDDPAFEPQEPSQESRALLIAKVDEDIENTFLSLPDDPRLDPIRSRGADLHQLLTERPQVTAGGRLIRIHGDYHLGQTLATQTGWLLVDFEGEPALALSQRRMKRSGLRDVASMLRSFAYAAAAVRIQGRGEAPADFESRAREAFLDSYLTEVDSKLLPNGEAAISHMLALFEIEKILYELRYELDNRPDWVPIPVAGIERLLEAV
jgi:maltokinase